MFEELKKRLGKRDDMIDDEMEFKPFEDVSRPESAPTPEREAPVAHEPAPASDSVELKVIRPEEYSEVASVADHLLAGCTVVLNLEALDRPAMMRMLDFLNGVTYCTDGEIKKVAQTTFIITPHANVDISDM